MTKEQRAREAAEKIAEQYEHGLSISNVKQIILSCYGEQKAVCPSCGYDPSKWVTIGTIRVDIESETETFTRVPQEADEQNQGSDAGQVSPTVGVGQDIQTPDAIQWEEISPGSFNPEFSGYTAAPYFTGYPERGWCLYSRGSGGCWNQKTKEQRAPFEGYEPQRINGEWFWVNRNGESFADYLPLTAVRTAPGEYDIMSSNGRRLWFMEGASLSDWVCASVNGYDGALRAIALASKSDTSVRDERDAAIGGQASGPKSESKTLIPSSGEQETGK